jgi:solute carrier family 35 protein F1/2
MCVFSPIWLIRTNDRKKFFKVFKQKYWKYALLALTDVEANYFIIKAYSLTRVTTIQVFKPLITKMKKINNCKNRFEQVIDAFVLPITVLLSFIFLKQIYKLNHFLGILSCLLGCALIIVADTLVKNDESI